MKNFIIYTDKQNNYRFNLRANNGHIILISEGYIKKSGVLNGIESVKINSQKEERFERKLACDGSFYFFLMAGNGKIIGNSEMYKSKQGRERGIKSVQKTVKKYYIIKK